MIRQTQSSPCTLALHLPVRVLPCPVVPAGEKQENIFVSVHFGRYQDWGFYHLSVHRILLKEKKKPFLPRYQTSPRFLVQQHFSELFEGVSCLWVPWKTVRIEDERTDVYPHSQMATKEWESSQRPFNCAEKTSVILRLNQYAALLPWPALEILQETPRKRGSRQALDILDENSSPHSGRRRWLSEVYL